MTRPFNRLAVTAIMAALTAGPALAGTFKTVSINGDFSDWAGVPLVDSDPADNPTGPEYW
jgi:hypothetical protein